MIKGIKIVEQQIRKMPAYVFKNKHGEQFNIYCNGVLTFMGGDEVAAMVADEHKIGDEIIPLFNPNFSIWNKEELYELGKALVSLNAPEATNER